MLKQMLLKECENQRGLATKLAKIAGYQNAGGFKRMLEKPDDKDIEKLDGLLKAAKTIYEDNFESLLIDFAKTLNPNTLTSRLLLEYATVYRIHPLKSMLIESLKSADNKESNEWAFVYEIDHKIETGEIGLLEGVQLLNSKSYISYAMKVYSQIAQFYCYYDMRNVPMLNVISKELEHMLGKIANPFLKSSYFARYYLIKIDINLHNNRIGNLLEDLFLIEDSLDPIKTYVYLQAGNATMMKSYDKSKMYFEKALECKTGNSEKEIKKSLNFLNLLWDKPEKYILDEDRDLSNELFFYIKTGNKKQAIKTLGEIEFDKLTDHQKGFNMYYQGLLFNDMEMFYKSVEYFNVSGEKFYKQLPINELRRMGEKEFRLSALSA